MARIKTKKYTLDYTQSNGVILLDMIQVKENYRNKGIATKAIQRFLKMCKNKSIELHAYPQDTTTDMYRIIRFYSKFGFDIKCGNDITGYEMTLN
jgi:GNAT superfamily N-acetyltransferase